MSVLDVDMGSEGGTKSVSTKSGSEVPSSVCIASPLNCHRWFKFCRLVTLRLVSLCKKAIPIPMRKNLTPLSMPTNITIHRSWVVSHCDWWIFLIWPGHKSTPSLCLVHGCRCFTFKGPFYLHTWFCHWLALTSRLQDCKWMGCQTYWCGEYGGWVIRG